MFQTYAAMVIRRRIAALAFFQGTHLQGVIVRHIPSDEQRAQNTITGFVQQVCGRYQLDAVTFEQGAKTSQRIERGYECARIAFTDHAVSLTNVPLRELLASYASRPVRDRHHLRLVVRRIWPSLDNRGCSLAVLDAAAVGLYSQTNRLLRIQDERQ